MCSSHQWAPVGIAVHPRTHRLYVADTGNHRIKILDENLNFIGNFGGRGIGNYQFKRPHDISFVMDGNNITMYVADHGNNRIQVFTANDIVYSGQSEGHIGAHVQVQGAGGSIFAIPNDGVAGNENLRFHSPERIAVNTVTGRVYVADTGSNRIKALDADLKFIRRAPWSGTW